MRNKKQKQNLLDRDLSPSLKNSPYLEPPKMILQPRPPENSLQKQKTDSKNLTNKNKYQFPYNYTNSQYHNPKTARIIRPNKKGKTNQYAKRPHFVAASNSRFNQCFNDKYFEEQKNSPYNENFLETCRLAKLRTDLRMKEQKNEEREERKKINKETAEAIKLETEYETETNDLVFAKNDRGIRIIPSYDRINIKMNKMDTF